jgi:hypothetical protein
MNSENIFHPSLQSSFWWLRSVTYLRSSNKALFFVGMMLKCDEVYTYNAFLYVLDTYQDQRWPREGSEREEAKEERT